MHLSGALLEIMVQKKTVRPEVIRCEGELVKVIELASCIVSTN